MHVLFFVASVILCFSIHTPMAFSFTQCLASIGESFHPSLYTNQCKHPYILVGHLGLFFAVEEEIRRVAEVGSLAHAIGIDLGTTYRLRTP